MSFTIKNTKSGVLCYTCKHGQTITYTNNDERVVCHWGVELLNITKAVEECTEFRTVNEKSDYELEKIAWIIDVDASHKMVGFVPPGSERHKKLLDD
jgi:hypothetical protein